MPLCLHLLGTPLLAAEREDFRVFSEGVVIPERGSVTHYSALLRGSKFTFLPPPAWRVEVNADQKRIVLIPREFGAAIVCDIKPGKTGELGPEELKKVILSRYPDATFGRASRCYLGELEGNQFDFTRTLPKRGKVAIRLAFIPYAKGLVELQLTTSVEKFPDYDFAFGALCTSFRVQAVTVPAPAK